MMVKPFNFEGKEPLQSWNMQIESLCNNVIQFVDTMSTKPEIRDWMNNRPNEQMVE